MPTLYSYCIPFDEGAAPNPFWGICTLNICKPVIRRVAKVGDWVVATGSKQKGFENKVVYAMEITDKKSMWDYFHFCKDELPQKFPNFHSDDYRERVGDCIYDFSFMPAKIMKSVHNEGNRDRDFRGMYCLLSDHFYYFGENPIELPQELLPIVIQGQGHKSKSNEPYLHEFLDWILKQTNAKNKVLSEPQARFVVMANKETVSQWACFHQEMDDIDEEIGCD